VYSVDTNGIASIRHLAIATFRKGIWENELLFQKTRDDFLLWANNEREAGQPNPDLRPLIAALAALAKLLPAFPSLLEPYLHQTVGFYHDRADTLVGEVESGTMSPTRYVEWVLEKAVEERERAEACLDADVGKKAVDVVRAEAGEKMSKRVVRRGERGPILPRSIDDSLTRSALDEAMDNADAQALSRLYQFSVDVHVFKDLSQSLEQHIDVSE
jgi:cullin-4